MAAELEELIVGALSGDDDAISKLSAKIKSSEIQELRDNAGHFDSLFDTLDEVISKSEIISRLCIELAEKDGAYLVGEEELQTIDQSLVLYSEEESPTVSKAEPEAS